jgi:hypothetical protein
MEPNQAAHENAIDADDLAIASGDGIVAAVIYDRAAPVDDEDAGATAASYSALSAHVHPPRSRIVEGEMIAGDLKSGGTLRPTRQTSEGNSVTWHFDGDDAPSITAQSLVRSNADGQVVEYQALDSVIAEAGETLRPSVAAVHDEISRRARVLAATRDAEKRAAEEVAKIKAINEKRAADLLDLMRDAGIASTGVVVDDEVRTVTVVIRHDHRIDDLDAAIAALRLDGIPVPMTEPKEPEVDLSAIKRKAKIRPDGLAGVVPVESAHLRWT